jgi:hypothetical protein
MHTSDNFKERDHSEDQVYKEPFGQVSPQALRHSIVNQHSTNAIYSTVTRGWHNQHTWVHITKGLAINPQPQRASLLCDSDIIVKQAALPWDSVTQHYIIATTGRITVGLSATPSPQQAALPWDSVTQSYIITTTGRITMGLSPASSPQHAKWPCD